MADNTQKLIELFRANRPDLSSLNDNQVTQILQKARPELFPKPQDNSLQLLKQNPSKEEQAQIESIGINLPNKIEGVKQPQYYFTAAADEPPKQEDDGFLDGLRESWSQSKQRIQFFKENPERAEDIKGQATAYQFEPILTYLDPKEEDPITRRVAKELVMLTGVAPLMSMTIAEDPIKGIAEMGRVMSDMATDWLKLVDPDKREEGWNEIKRSPLFHATFLSGVNKARKASKVKSQKSNVIKEIDKEIKEFTDTAEQVVKDNPQFAETLQQIARDKVKNTEFNQLVKERFKMRPKPLETSSPTPKILLKYKKSITLGRNTLNESIESSRNTFKKDLKSGKTTEAEIVRRGTESYNRSQASLKRFEKNPLAHMESKLQSLNRLQSESRIDFTKDIANVKSLIAEFKKTSTKQPMQAPKTSPKIEKINAEIVNLQETLKSQQLQLSNQNLTGTQRQQINKSIGKIEELIEDNRIKGQQLGYDVKIDITPSDRPEYFTNRKPGQVLSQQQLDKLYLDSSSDIILLPESKGLHEKAQKFYEQSFKEMEGFNKRSWEDLKKSLVAKTVDVSGNVKKAVREKGALGEQAAMLHDLALGSNSKSVMLFEDAAKNIFNGLTKQERKLLDTIIEARRSITIQEYKPNYKAGGGYQSNTALLKVMKENDPRKFEKLNARADSFFNEMRVNLKELYDNGLINEKTFNLLKDKDYTRKEFIDYVDPVITYSSGGKKISVASSGLKRLEEGSAKTVNLDQAGKLFRNINMVQSRIAKNKANIAMRDMIRENPKNGIAIEVKAGEKPPVGYSPISYFEKGKKKEFYLENSLANEWVLADPAATNSLANFIGWASGTKMLKAMATGYNPEFAITNMLRDIPYMWMTTTEYSPHLPKFALQLGRDLTSTAKDAFSRSGRYRDYVMEGGGMEFLTHQGGLGKFYKPTGKVTNALEAFKEVAKYAGETSEVWVRLALRERALRNGKSPLKATYEARNYLDFAQGGSWIKALDTASPYLNASTQATRGLLRAPGKDPKAFATKTAWIGATASSLWFANNAVNPEAYEEIDERIRNDNWIITTPFFYKDERGNKRYMYYRLPKDQGQRVIASSTDALLDYTYNNKVPSDQVLKGLKDLASVIPVDDPLPPLLDAYLGYTHNVDFFRSKPIFDDKGRPVEPSAEFNRNTGQAFVDFGEATDMSPARTEYAVKQFTTNRNIWTDLVGGGYKMLTEGQDEEATEEFTREMLNKIPGARRFISFTNPYKRDKDLKRTIVEQNTKDKVRREFGDNIWQQFRAGEMTKSEVRKAIAESNYSSEDKGKILKRFIFSAQTRNVRNPGFFYDGKDLNPVSRADYFFRKYEKANKEERKILVKEMNSVQGFTSKKFIQRWNTLTKQYLEQNTP